MHVRCDWTNLNASSRHYSPIGYNTQDVQITFLSVLRAFNCYSKFNPDLPDRSCYCLPKDSSKISQIHRLAPCPVRKSRFVGPDISAGSNVASQFSTLL